MIVSKGCLNSLNVNLEFLRAQLKIDMVLSGNTELNFYINKKQEKKIKDLLIKAMHNNTRIVVKIEEEKNASKS
jgi:hypothetical protein